MQLALEMMVDGIALYEVGVDWATLGHWNRLPYWIGKESHHKLCSTVSQNSHESHSRPSQQGGTAIIALHSLLKFRQSNGLSPCTLTNEH